MKYILLTTVFVVSLSSSLVHAHTVALQKTNAVYKSEDVSLRFHAQWTVDEGTQKKLHETYGLKRISFDQRGRPVPCGLSPTEATRWKRLYNLCMSDGCYYCDAPEGSCELGTCGVQNSYCKPYVGKDGQPLCGRECADYAFTSILICSDLSKTK